jgi:amidase
VPVNPPSREELQRIARQYHFELSEAELETFAAVAPATLAGFGRLDELPDAMLPVRYPRADLGYRPTGAENPSNGWTWKCSIPGAPDGPPAGKRVGIKDNACVAGIPMLNGSPGTSSTPRRWT